MAQLNSLKNNLASLDLNCDYWDVRIEDAFETNIEINNNQVISCTSSPSLGAFVRVLKNGFWFYQATTEISNIKNILVELSLQTPLAKLENYKFQPQQTSSFFKIQSHDRKVSAIPLKNKLELMQNYSLIAMQNSNVTSAKIFYKDIYKIKLFLNSTGNEFEFDFNQCGFSVSFTLTDSRSHLFDDKCAFYGSSFQDLYNQESSIKKYITESQVFLDAPTITPGKYNVLLDPEATGTFTHESFGHKSEADFMLGDIQSLKDWEIGKKIASEKLSIVDYGGLENTSGYCPIDDDGIMAQKNYLIKNGILSGRLHSLNTAVQLNEKPTGNSRAINFNFDPIVRMTSTYIEPGSDNLETILKSNEGAILIEGSKHGSGFSTFTLAPRRGYIIEKNGNKKPIRLSVVSGSVFETIKNIQAVTSEFRLINMALGGCGKSDQWPLPVSLGGPYILVKDMQVS